MSRVRILNLPKNLTDPEVRKHFTTNLPPNAPRDMTITDVFIKRDRDDPAITRMLFVGFKTVAAGQFAVSYFHGAYLRTAKMTVELASGLNDAPLPHKERLEQRKREREERDKAWADKKKAEAEGSVGGPDATKGPRTESAKDAFVKARMESGKTTASWASDLLLPEQPATDATKTGEAEEEDGFGGEGKREHARATEKRIAAEKLAKFQTLIKDAAAEQGDKAIEEHAIPTEDLNEVSDFDFLASLSGATPAAPKQVTAEPKQVTAEPKQVTAEPKFDSFNDGESSIPRRSGGGGGYYAPVGGAEGEEEGEDASAPLKGPFTGGLAQPPAAFEEEEDISGEDIVKETRRVRIGNLPFVAGESEVRNHVTSVVGPVEHIHIPLTHDTKESKGAAFVTFVHVCDALEALKSLRGAVFMGRLLRVSAATADPHSAALNQKGAKTGAASMFEEENTGATLREKKAAQQKKADQKGLSWNATYMSSSAAVQGMADKLNVDATQIVSIDEKGAAVRAAVAEAFLTSEAKAVLSDEGIDFDVLQETQRQGGALHKARSKTTILVKNLNSSQTKDAGYLAELIKLFKRFGTIENVAAPGSRLFALFNFLHPQDARAAFQRLSYRKFNGLPLFLEWAPLGSLRDEADDEEDNAATNKPAASSTTGEDGVVVEPTLSSKMQVFSLYMSNLPMKGNDEKKKKAWLTEDKVRAFIFEYCPKVARQPEKYIKALNPRGERGQAFVTCVDADAQGYILARLNGKPMDGRIVKVEVSRSAAVAAVADQNGHFEEDLTKEPEHHQKNHTSCPPGCNPHKIVVKNLPFEATEKDLRELFASFSDIKSVRVPQKVHRFGAHRENNHRGFGFVEFLTEQEAASALKLLSSTHLYGRHLVLQYANNEQ